MKKAKHGKHGINKEETESKKKISKKVVYIIIAILVLILVGTAIVFGLSHIEGINLGNILNREENVEIVVEENQSEEIKKEKEFLGLKFQNISMRRENGITYFSADVVNETDTKFEGRDVKIIFQNEDLTQIANLTTKMDSVEPGATGKFEVSTSVDLISAYTFKVQ